MMQKKSVTSLGNDMIQIAGVIDQKEADELIACGATLLGFPLRLPVNSEDLSEAEAAAIIKGLADGIDAVLITYQNEAQDISNFCQEMGAKFIQLHGEVSKQELEKLRLISPKLTIFKSLVTGKYSLDELLQSVKLLSPFVDAFITDSFDSKTGATGATGKLHDWSISRALVIASPKPVILAGGLTPENVYEAIMTVKPAGVDTHTKVEAPDGRKDLAKVKKFISESKRAFAALA